VRRIAWLGALLLCASVGVRAQRHLQWDTVDVDARLDAEGVLHVSETQTMVFTGDWNGGERRFTLRPYHRLSNVSVARIDPETGQEHPLVQDGSLDDVNDFAVMNDRVRWRSRLASDAPFSNDRRTYVIRYELSRILARIGDDNDVYRLDHDFALPDRNGAIDRFSLQLAIDSAWQPESEIRERYTAGPLAPGQSFFVSANLRHVGAGTPVATDTRRQPAATLAVAGIGLATAVALAAFFRRESTLGRFARIPPESVNADWMAANVLTLPAEVVGAAWDGAIGASEVVALMARMHAEGTLVSETGLSESLTLRLNVDRDSLHGHEFALVNALFFDGGSVTSTDAVKAHYKETGFDPAAVIAPKLESAMSEALPAGAASAPTRHLSAALLSAAGALLAYDAFSGGAQPGLWIFAGVAVAAGLLAKIPGITLFRRRVDWGPLAAMLCLIPAFVALLGIAAFLWFLATPDAIDLSGAAAAACALLAVWILHSALNAMKSRQSAAAIAFRKKLAAGRQFFVSELERERPALRDEWFPWVLAFGLAGTANRWSTRYAASEDRSGSTLTTSSSSDSPASSGTWTGYGGGRSGGAGATAAWTTAAATMASGVAAPSSDGGSSGGGGGSSSSGGGGGGGW
jgi:hypothetical protein